MSVNIKINVDAGNHVRHRCPVTVSIPKEMLDVGSDKINALCLRDQSGRSIPVQCLDQGGYYKVCWMIDDLCAHDKHTYTLFDDIEGVAGTGIELIEAENKIDINIQGRYFTSYVCDPNVAKPYIGPVIGPYGDSYTRLDFEIKEHPHHRSIWLAIGDVNGVDMWNEPEGVYGKQKHKHFSEMFGGPVFARLTSHNVWTDFKEKPMIDESRTVTIYNTPADGRFMDMEITFKASYGKVEFGASKEAGPLGIRVAESMKVKNGGTMVNSYGAIGEKECWGHRAEWCDYHGMIEGHRLGISVFDNPDNENYPTYWHIRDYGLIAPNNFYFIGGKLLKPDEVVKYKYRIYFHSGDTEQAMVADHYNDYINPPQVTIEAE